MAKAENSKQRILALGEILLQETDEEHRLTAAELEEMLRQREIPGERKSIYRDLAMLADQAWTSSAAIGAIIWAAEPSSWRSLNYWPTQCSAPDASPRRSPMNSSANWEH